MITVTKTWLPNREKYNAYVDRIYAKGWITNNGELVRELEQRLKDYLGVKHLIPVANGTLALQVAYKALELKGEVITTPFSFVATTSSLVWEGLKPVFADINSGTLNIDPEQIKNRITEHTSAIVPVHVFGNTCDVEAIREIAEKHKLKVIYDAAHAFGVKYKNDSVLNYGDISILSFHATKLFHTIEGGAIITNDDDVAGKVRLLMNFGITGPGSIESLGINTRMNEFEAAMGLCMLDDMQEIIEQRGKIHNYYKNALQDDVKYQEPNPLASENHSYMPVLLESEKQVLAIEEKLKQYQIMPRRYFYPSLDTLDFFSSNQYCENSRDIASRILCLPLYPGLDRQVLDTIIAIIRQTVETTDD